MEPLTAGRDPGESQASEKDTNIIISSSVLASAGGRGGGVLGWECDKAFVTVELVYSVCT